MNIFKKLFRRFIYCDHFIVHLENFSGDHIIHVGCRSYFICEKCGKIFRSHYLHYLDKCYNRKEENHG